MSGNHRMPTEEKSGKLYTVNVNDLAWEFKYCPILYAEGNKKKYSDISIFRSIVFPAMIKNIPLYKYFLQWLSMRA